VRFFIRESTPAGYTIKIVPKSWQFIVFDKKGNSVDIYGDSQKFTYSLPVAIFVGSNFRVMRDCDREYNMLKIRNGSVIIPYQERGKKAVRYAFAKTNIALDTVPVRFLNESSLSRMMREIDVGVDFDWVLVDKTVSQNDLYVIEHRYSAKSIINTARAEVAEGSSENSPDVAYNLNFLSQNPFFLAAFHLRSMDTSSLNQLILDFELTPIDLEAIIRYIDMYLESDISDRGKTRLRSLRVLSNFYLQVILHNDDEVKEIIENENDHVNLSYLNTLLIKIKVLFSDSVYGDIITGYEEKLNAKNKELTQ